MDEEAMMSEVISWAKAKAWEDARRMHRQR
jgi:hypothetical protein